MSNHNDRSFGLSRKATLVAAGFLAAAGSSVLLPTVNWSAVQASHSQNPVITKIINEAKKHRSKGRLKEAAELLEQHARPENPEVLLNYAKLLARGWGVSRNLDKAREKLLLAVQHDFAKWGEAAFELGRVYRQSIGADCERIAFEWFMESARAGHMQAHAELGRHHARGIGVDIDLQKALEHYRIAARAGYANSLVSFIHKVTRASNQPFSQTELAAIVEEAIPALENEAAGGRGSSAKVLGRLYSDGVLVDADEALAEMWFERGARLGDSGSMVELALGFMKKPGGKPRTERAIALLHKAASLRNAGAYTEIGRLHMKSFNGLAKSEARTWFEKGVAAGHAGAMMELAKVRLKGDPDKKQLAEIGKLLKRGAAKGHLGCKRLLIRLASEGKIKDLVELSIVPSKLKKVVKTPIGVGLGEVSQLQKLRRLAEKQRAKNMMRRAGDALTGATVITPFKRGS